MCAYDLQDWDICRAQIVINMGHPHLIQMLFKWNADFLGEKAAEILVAEPKAIRNLIEGNRLCVVFGDVGDDLFDTALVFRRLRKIIPVELDGKMRQQLEQNMKDQRLDLQPVSEGVIDTQLRQFPQVIADLQIIIHELLCELGTVADDLVVSLVLHEGSEIFIIDMDDELHIIIRTAELMNLSRVDDNELTLDHRVCDPFCGHIRVTVEKIGDLQGRMPVRGDIGSVSAEVNRRVLIDQLVFWNIYVIILHDYASVCS
jgi:hypothetical protein